MKKRLKIKTMNIYIDGSCRPSSKFGSYGVLIIDDKGNRHTLTGTQEDVTNNIMELTALIEALKYIRDNQLDSQYEIEIFSDSQYVIKGLTDWWPNWEANNYQTRTGPVKNLELWKELVALTKVVKSKLTWVKGHALNEKHNEVDKIVYELTANRTKA